MVSLEPKALLENKESKLVLRCALFCTVRNLFFRFDCTLKNISVPSQNAYLRNLIEKVESVINSMRWKPIFNPHTNIKLLHFSG